MNPGIFISMSNSTITTEGVYTKGVVIPKVKPSGQRRAIITFLPPKTGKPDISDEEIWEEMEPTAREIRKQLFHETYPDLYAKPKKKRT